MSRVDVHPWFGLPTDRPLLFDGCSGVGGAAAGYRRAGWFVFGVDKEPQPEYAGDVFVQGDALAFAMRWGHLFDAHHWSVPCQGYNATNKGTNKHRPKAQAHPRLIEAARWISWWHRVPFVLENVMSAPLRPDVVLCGEAFELEVIRHRKFELGRWAMPQPAHVKHRGRVANHRHGQWYDGPYFPVYGDGGAKGTTEEWQRAMGIDWTANRKSIAEAIPPAYTELIGRELLAHVRRSEVAT